MRRPAGVKSVISRSRVIVSLASYTAAVAILPSALFDERFSLITPAGEAVFWLICTLAVDSPAPLSGIDA